MKNTWIDLIKANMKPLEVDKKTTYKLKPGQRFAIYFGGGDLPVSSGVSENMTLTISHDDFLVVNVPPVQGWNMQGFMYILWESITCIVFSTDVIK